MTSAAGNALTDQTPDWLTVAEVAAALRVSRMHVYRLIDRGALPASNFGDRALRVRRADLNAYIEGSRIGGEPA